MRLEENSPLPYIKPTCIGCKTFFTYNQQLSPLTSSYFDMVQLPIKKTKQRIQILRMICAFLSSKGGHIYLGIEKTNIQVKGIKITTKQQDQFKFYIKQLLTKIHPKVDLSNRQEVETVFVPVLTQGKQPTGKIIIKIIVKQGQRDRVYTYVQKVKVSNPKGGQPEEFQLRYGFVMDGNIYLRLEGIKLIDEISSKARQQVQKCKFHQGCNPKPLQIDPSVKLISFQGFDSAKQQNQLLNLLKANLNDEDISFQHRYNEKDRVIILQFHSQQDAVTVQKLINNNLSQLKKIGMKLLFEGIQFNTFIYKKSSQYGQQKGQQKEGKLLSIEIKQQEKRQKDNKILYGICNYKTIKKEELLKALKQQLPQNLLFQVKFHLHSVVLQLKSQQQIKMVSSALERLPNIKNYTNNINDGQLAYGKMTGNILVYGINQKSKDYFRQYVSRKFQTKLQKVEYENQKGRLVVILRFSLKDVNQALDSLITGENDKELKAFGKQSKMGFILECE